MKIMGANGQPQNMPMGVVQGMDQVMGGGGQQPGMPGMQVPNFAANSAAGYFGGAMGSSAMQNIANAGGELPPDLVTPAGVAGGAPA